MQKQYHLKRQPIPAGYRIYEEAVDVAGLQYRKSAARSFCRAKEPELSFRPEPTNKHDQNAICVVGSWRGWFWNKEADLGYVPREIAARIAQAGLGAAVRPRLLKTYVGKGGFVEVEFQIMGPKEKYAGYSSS